MIQENFNFESLISKKIESLYQNDSKETLIFKTSDGYFIKYNTCNECCNSVWFSSINGLDSLIGGTVNKVICKGWNDLEGNDYEVLESCFWTISTEKGFFDIEVRNSHNGYYGGYVECSEITTNINHDYKILTKDY